MEVNLSYNSFISSLCKLSIEDINTSCQANEQYIKWRQSPGFWQDLIFCSFQHTCPDATEQDYNVLQSFICNIDINRIVDSIDNLDMKRILGDIYRLILKKEIDAILSKEKVYYWFINPLYFYSDEYLDNKIDRPLKNKCFLAATRCGAILKATSDLHQQSGVIFRYTYITEIIQSVIDQSNLADLITVLLNIYFDYNDDVDMEKPILFKNVTLKYI